MLQRYFNTPHPNGFPCQRRPFFCLDSGHKYFPTKEIFQVGGQTRTQLFFFPRTTRKLCHFLHNFFFSCTKKLFQSNIFPGQYTLIFCDAVEKICCISHFFFVLNKFFHMLCQFSYVGFYLYYL